MTGLPGNPRSNSIQDLLGWGIARLNQAEVKDSRISSERILCKLLNVQRHFLILENSKTIDSKIADEFKNSIEKRARRIPLQYIIGETEFYGLPFKSDLRALIPRPETEILVDLVIKKLIADHNFKLLDIGTGSGIIAVVLARHIPGLKIVATDISPEALQLAAENARLNSVSQNIEFVKADFNDINEMRALGKFNCVVSNPPYVSVHEKSILDPEVYNFEPAIALFSGDDTLASYKAIIKTLPYILSDNGMFAFEMGSGQYLEILKLFDSNFADLDITKDLAGIERVISGIFRPGK